MLEKGKLVASLEGSMSKSEVYGEHYGGGHEQSDTFSHFGPVMPLFTPVCSFFPLLFACALWQIALPHLRGPTASLRSTIVSFGWLRRKTKEQKLIVLRWCVFDVKPHPHYCNVTKKRPVVCDGMENQFLATFGAWPTRYYIVQDGVLKFKIQLSTEPGRFDVHELRTWLEANCGSE